MASIKNDLDVIETALGQLMDSGYETCCRCDFETAKAALAALVRVRNQIRIVHGHVGYIKKACLCKSFDGFDYD